MVKDLLDWNLIATFAQNTKKIKVSYILLA